ncbi:hypothetical protein AeMF1_005673, partial [Aphanomyces euteiches]
MRSGQSEDEQLIQAGNEASKEEQLIQAAESGDLKSVRALVANDANVMCADTHGETPLHKASRYGHLGIVKEILDCGALVDLKDEYGWTPLIYASYNGHLDVVKEFLAHSASVDASDNNGWTPLNRAAYSGHLDVVKELLAHNATIDAADNYGWTPLYSASYSGHLGVVKELLAHELDIVKELLERGASYDLTNKNGETARDVGDESIQDIFDTFLMSVSPSSIRFAIELIQKALVDTSDSNSEIILAASEVLSTTLNAQTQRMTVLTIGLMVERILRYFIRHESSDKAHAVLEVLKKIQNYFDTELLMVQPWKLKLRDIHQLAQIQITGDNLIRLQDHLLEATENSQINLKVQV